MSFLAPSYNLVIVATSLLIASFSSYVVLDLAKRVRDPRRGIALRWWLGGSLAMGTGVWCTHFVGMLAFSLPIALGYAWPSTALSWVAAVVAAAVGLAMASRVNPGWRRLCGSALAMGAGICTMHYTGMAALDMAPAIVWDRGLVALSGLISIVASGLALAMFSWMRGWATGSGPYRQVGAAAFMGAAIWGMHYAGMAAANFPTGSVCLSAGALTNNLLGALISLSSLALLGMTLLTSNLDARLQSGHARLADSLRASNAQLQEFNETLRQRALHDALTALPNRVAFEERLAQALAHASAGAPSLAVMFIDLDGFKQVNDSLGHAVGDGVLREAARRLQASIRPGDTVARIGGDEFVVLMENLASADVCVALAERLLREVAAPFEVAGHHIRISASIGIVAHPHRGPDERLVANADAAMFAAKRGGGNAYALFESHMESHALEHLGLENDLRGAVQRGELSLHYQPKVDVRLGTVDAVEALLRWTHPSRGEVSPVDFIPVAERSRLICELGDWVIDEACKQLRAWSLEGLSMRVAVNLSAHQLRDRGLADKIAAALAHNGIEPARLLCEITETVVMEDIAGSQRTFDDLARIGVFLSIDDFGTGYSSLSYLRQLPARQLKIDRSFVRDLDTCTDARAIVSAVVQLAHALGLRVVGEGVEEEAQRRILVELGCDELQGFLFARPMPAEKIPGWTEDARGGFPVPCTGVEGATPLCASAPRLAG
ncbi:MAG: EAL domain-containing protein [Pseudomonadota bacterium]|nr:EAL domain-containing protein [Pseudomonadota bacterium]